MLQAIMKLVTKGRENIPANNENELKIPDISGMSLRSCIKVLSSLGVEFKINGCGKVISQSPEPGSIAGKNQIITVNCDSNTD